MLQLPITPLRLKAFSYNEYFLDMSLQYLLSKRARVYTPEADDGDIEQALTEEGDADNDLTDTLTCFSFGEFKLELNGTGRQLQEFS